MGSFPLQTLDVTALDAVSMGASQTSSAISIKDSLGYAAQFVWSAGTLPIGTFIVEGTNDNVEAPMSNPTYTPVSSSAVSGSSGDFMLNVERAMYSYVRVRYARTSGTATLTVKVSVKRG